MHLQENENYLKGSWLHSDGEIRRDAVEQRIEWLINNNLKEIASDSSGWNILYQDVRDGRYWELTFEESEMHGGGPKTLRHKSFHDVQGRYNLENQAH